MERKHILVTAKAYPVESASYTEVVCTAGITDDGQLIRIYPVPYRILPREKQFRKYQWINIEVERRPANKDRRKESNRCNIATLELGEVLGTEDNWERRKEAFIRKVKVYERYSDMLRDSSIDLEDFISLAVFKPATIKGISFKKLSDSELSRRDEMRGRAEEQPLLDFEDLKQYKSEPAKVVPYIFYYDFVDIAGESHRCMIEDWEISMLYWNSIGAGKDEHDAVMAVKAKYEGFAKGNDVYFFMGTRMKEHTVYKRRDYFSIISVFYPKKDDQLRLF